MSVAITIPRLGWSMDEGAFREWVKRNGDYVAAGDPIFLLESEKAIQEVESIDAGILHIPPNAPKEGDVVKVGVVIGYLLDDGEEPPELPPAVATASQPEARQQPSGGVAAMSSPLPSFREPNMGQVGAAPSVRRLARELNVDLASRNLTGTISKHDVRRAAQVAAANRSPAAKSASAPIPKRNADPSLPTISPRAVRTARRFALDWTTLIGSGRNGRIRERDVMAAAGNGTLPDGVLVPATSIRKRIAERLLQSVQTTIPVTLTTVVRVDAVLGDRAERKQQATQEETIPALHDYFMLAVAKTLQQFPTLNSCWMHGEILQPNGIHIGLAVDTEKGLYAPVVRDADKKSLLELAKASARLVSHARNRKLTSGECAGGTFTVSNLGAFGIDAFTPIINLGQSAILGIGAVRKSPQCADDGSLMWIQQMTLSLTFDHQVVDGAPAAKFLQHLCRYIENLECSTGNP